MLALTPSKNHSYVHRKIVLFIATSVVDEVPPISQKQKPLKKESISQSNATHYNSNPKTHARAPHMLTFLENPT